jgi:hypothetical protein
LAKQRFLGISRRNGIGRDAPANPPAIAPPLNASSVRTHFFSNRLICLRFNNESTTGWQLKNKSLPFSGDALSKREDSDQPKNDNDYDRQDAPPNIEATQRGAEIDPTSPRFQ